MVAIPVIGRITDAKKTRVALVQGQQIVSAPATALSDALGIPAGGTTGQVLTKSSATDYDSDWADIPAQGDFSGPASAGDGNLVVFDGTTGKLGKDSGKQPADFALESSLATVATTGNYTDLTNTPTLRQVLTASTAYYVATTGSDSNDGLTSGTAFLTIQRAINVVLGLDLSTYNVTIQVADGTYTGSTSVTAPFVGSGTVTIRGNPTTPANCVINPSAGGFFGSNGARFSLSGFKLTPGAAAIQADGAGTIITLTGNMEFGAAGTSHLAVTVGGTITVNTNYTISGSAQVHWNADGLSAINCIGRTITLTGTPAFAPCFALAGQLAFIRCYSCTFTGSATGARYNVQYNSVIHTNGGGASYLPGSSNGSAANGGLYR